MLKILVISAALLGLTACQPPQSRYTKNGQPCHPVGYGFAPLWVSPDGNTWCAAR